MGNVMCCGCVSSSNIGIVERFGRFNKIAEPGLFFKLPVVDNLKHNISMKKKQVIINVDTKTADNVFCKVIVAVIFSVKQDSIYHAVYGYENFSYLVDSYVQNEIRSELTRLTLDESFLQKLTMSDNVKKSLKENISFGYNIHEVLINDIEPDPKVRAAMNEINTAQRNRLAKEEIANAYKIETISKAQADAQASEIYGCGVAREKQAVIRGLKESFPDLSDGDIAKFMVASEQVNILKEMSYEKPSTIFIPYDNKINFNMTMPQ